MTATLLGVRVDQYTLDQLTDVFRRFVLSKKSHHIVTLNPEILVYAQKDSSYRGILNATALNIPDGVGITLAGRLRKYVLRRITGFDATMAVVGVAAGEGATVFFLGGWSEDLAHRAALFVKKRFPHVRIVGAERGPVLRVKDYKLIVDPQEQELIIDHLNLLKPAVLLVGFGHPKQEKWIADVLPRLPSVRIAMGVGGVFDYFAGAVMRAPRLMRALGLEWLFRLFRQPWRFPRIFTATVRFSLAVLRERR